MRNLEERMAAIKSRSHARIARRRKQLVSLCLPLAVALCISTAFLIYEQPVQSYQVTTIPTTTQQTVYPGTVTVRYGNHTVTHNEKAIVEALQELLSVAAMEQEVMQITTQEYKDDGVKMTSLSRQYVIELETPEGEVAHYRLTDSVLTNLDTQEQLLLSGQRLHQLLELLELQ